MKVLIAWSSLSGYASACWRALGALPGVELRVVAFAPAARSAETSAFSEELVAGLDATLVDPSDHGAMEAALRAREDAEVAVVTGWIHPCFVAMGFRRRAASLPTLMTLDLPWEGSAKQWAQCVRRRRYVVGLDGVVTASAASETYALKLGCRPERVERGLYAYDGEAFAPRVGGVGHASAGAWPRRFVTVGRMIPEKGLDVLIDGYRAYRARVDGPWDLLCCGRGPQSATLVGVAGIECRDFVAPAALPGVLRSSGVFVLASRYEPWGVALAEAMGSGLPAICSSAVHGGRDLVRDFHTGLTFRSEDPSELASAMVWMHEHRADLPAMGGWAASVAGAFTAELWARRWRAMLERVLDRR